MSTSFLAASDDRQRDARLLALIVARGLVWDSGLWRIEWKPGMGRCLVAATKIPPATKIFTERPIAVASGGTAAVIKVLAKLDRKGLEFEAAAQLHSRKDRASEGTGPWLASLAANNVHGAGGSVLDPKAGRRAVLGLLSSMMNHECCPSAVTHISGAEDGSLISLYTVRELRAGDPISISYVGAYQPTLTRRALLEKQHGFVCNCARCTKGIPEHTRAFQCPACGEGPCSPTSGAADCRNLVCDHCEAEMELDDEAWAGLEEAEACEVFDQAMMEVLHPYHHKVTLIYQHNLLKLAPGQRVEFVKQFADARERLYSGWTTESAAHPLVANDIEGAAVACLNAGDPEQAAEHFTDASARFASFYGPDSVDAIRCAKGAGMSTLEEYSRVAALEIHAHH